jgi:hypothetical protein
VIYDAAAVWSAKPVPHPSRANAENSTE